MLLPGPKRGFRQATPKQTNYSRYRQYIGVGENHLLRVRTHRYGRVPMRQLMEPM
jgi:hypothetical protein